MLLRTAETEPAARPFRSTMVRTKLDWAIIASLLAMAAFNLIVMAGHFGASQAHAAASACGASLA